MDFAAQSAKQGYTLLELVVVVSIVSVLAAIAVPSLRPVEDQRLDAAAAWVAETVRFARAEALRTGNPVYLEIDRDSEKLLVAEADLSSGNAVPGVTLTDPMTKQPLDIILPDVPLTAGVDVTDRPFDYPSGGRQASVVFDGQGLPFRPAGGTSQLLTLGEITLARGGQQRTVRVASVTGRVSIQ